VTQQRLWLLFAIVAGVSFAIQVSLPVDLSDRPETSYDTAPRGHAALFALLERFDATPGRWLSGLEMPPVEDTVWWVAPHRACTSESSEAAAAAAAEDDDDEDDTSALPATFEISVRPWLESGGTAIVWLSQPPQDDAAERSKTELDEDEPVDAERVREGWDRSLETARSEVREGQPHDCAAIAGFDLPPRRISGLEGGRPPEEGRYSPVAFSVGRAPDGDSAFDYSDTRLLPGPTLALFDMKGGARGVVIDWRPLWIDASDFSPLAIERSVGSGRLIVIADARILSNGRLARADSAPFVFDWIETFGEAWIDEHAHGVVPESGTFRYLATSPAWASGLGLFVLAGLVIWRGQAWPLRQVSEFDPETPTLAAYVDSVARLYSASRDHGHVFRRYRAVCLDRIRRALGLGPGTEVEIVLASLRSRSKNWSVHGDSGLSQLLTEDFPIPSASDLARHAARLDELVRVLRQDGRADALGDSAVEPTASMTKGIR
jgi:hypothetical protein